MSKLLLVRKYELSFLSTQNWFLGFAGFKCDSDFCKIGISLSCLIQFENKIRIVKCIMLTKNIDEHLCTFRPKKRQKHIFYLIILFFKID